MIDGTIDKMFDYLKNQMQAETSIDKERFESSSLSVLDNATHRFTNRKNNIVNSMRRNCEEFFIKTFKTMPKRLPRKIKKRYKNRDNTVFAQINKKYPTYQFRKITFNFK